MSKLVKIDATCIFFLDSGRCVKNLQGIRIVFQGVTSMKTHRFLSTLI